MCVVLEVYLCVCIIFVWFYNYVFECVCVCVCVCVPLNHPYNCTTDLHRSASIGLSVILRLSCLSCSMALVRAISSRTRFCSRGKPSTASCRPWSSGDRWGGSRASRLGVGSRGVGGGPTSALPEPDVWLLGKATLLEEEHPPPVPLLMPLA